LIENLTQIALIFFVTVNNVSTLGFYSGDVGGLAGCWWRFSAEMNTCNSLQIQKLRILDNFTGFNKHTI